MKARKIQTKTFTRKVEVSNVAALRIPYENTYPWNLPIFSILWGRRSVVRDGSSNMRSHDMRLVDDALAICVPIISSHPSHNSLECVSLVKRFIKLFLRTCLATLASASHEYVSRLRVTAVQRRHVLPPNCTPRYGCPVNCQIIWCQFDMAWD